MHEPLPQPPLIADVIADDPLPWARLMSAIVLVGLSLAIGYRSGRAPPPPEAVPQPVQERVVEGAELPPVGPPAAAALLPVPAVVAIASVAPSDLAARAELHRPGARSLIGRSGSRPSGRQVLRPRRDGVAAGKPGAIRQTARTRDQVRREYLRSREVVAAFTGEDSGSAYLAQAAARQRAARLAGAGHRRG